MDIDNKPNPATEAKKRWNAKNYTQIKISVSKEVASTFKAACTVAEVSIAGVLTQFMVEYGAVETMPKPCKETAPALSPPSKKKRDSAIREAISKLKWAYEAEEQSMENIPDNLRGAGNYEASEERVALMEEALDILERLY